MKERYQTESTPRSWFNTNRWNRICHSLWAPVYDWLASIFTARRRRSVEVASIQPGERLLILGAGMGLDLEFVPRHAAITAIVFTPAMIARLEVRARRLGLSFTAKVMDGQPLKFPDASFDVVVLHLKLAVIPDPLRCTKQAPRVLLPGGCAVIFKAGQCMTACTIFRCFGTQHSWQPAAPTERLTP